jgi:arsenate reductase (thioredoxin)
VFAEQLASKPNIIVLCTGNSCRSQMAEGFLRAAVADCAQVFSAGSKPAGYVHPLAIQVMAEAGIDISSHTSKHINDFLLRKQRVDAIITVCDNAKDECPMFPGLQVTLGWSFDDPAHAVGSAEHILNEFRRVRDEIKERFSKYGAEVKAGKLTGSLAFL